MGLASGYYELLAQCRTVDSRIRERKYNRKIIYPSTKEETKIVSEKPRREYYDMDVDYTQIKPPNKPVVHSFCSVCGIKGHNYKKCSISRNTAQTISPVNSGKEPTQQ